MGGCYRRYTSRPRLRPPIFDMSLAFLWKLSFGAWHIRGFLHSRGGLTSEMHRELSHCSRQESSHERSTYDARSTPVKSLSENSPADFIRCSTDCLRLRDEVPVYKRGRVVWVGANVLNCKECWHNATVSVVELIKAASFDNSN